MTFEIYEGRNQGYPCIPELAELDGAEPVSPVCRMMFSTNGSGYPVISAVPDVDAKLIKPLPEYMTICFGDRANDGYPWISELKAIVRRSESSLYFGDKKAERLYFNGKEIETAFCNDEKVFEIYSDREKIV